MNEDLINRLVKLITIGRISLSDVKDTDYKSEVENRL